MKKYLFLLMLALLPLLASAAIEIDGIWYIIDTSNKTAEVTHGKEVTYSNDGYETIIENTYYGTVSIPPSISISGEEYTVNSIGDKAFSSCSEITSVTIPNSVTSIGLDAFWSCSGLTSITIPNSVTSIGHAAFMHCGGLSSVTIPNSVTNIGSEAFYNCYGLKVVCCLVTNTDVINSYDRCFNSCNRPALYVPNEVLEDYQNSNWGSSGHFSEIRPLEDLQVGLATIEIDGICYNLNTSANTAEVISGGNYSGDIVIPSSITNSGITYSVTSIGDNAFSDCSGLTSISIPSSMTAMGGYAFSGCSNLSSVYITDLVKWCQIDFEDWGNPLNVCHHLYLNGVKVQDLVIPDGLTSICKDAFIGSDITSVTIPASITSIGNYAFAYCESLETITIHSTAISMNYASFSGCSALSSFICMSTTPLSYNNNAFDGGYGPINSNCILYVPSGTVNDYRNAGWGETFSNILEIGTTPEYEDVAIGSKTDWDAFASRVNAGETSLNAHLTASISDAVTTMVGTQSKPYGGTFNGNGYTLTVALSSDDMGCAPFANVRGATIENLKTQGTVTSSGWHASGLVGVNSGKLTIRNCWVDVSIYGSGFTGGFIGHAGEVPGNPLPVLIDNCLFTGSNDATDNAAGFVGWSTTYTPTITNCLNDGTFAYDGFAPIARSAGVGTITNCYYTTPTTCQGSYNDDRGIFTDKTGQELAALLGDGWKVDENNHVIPLMIREGTDPNTSSPVDITNRSISDSYSQEVNVYGTDYVYFPGNTTAFEGYMVCGVERSAFQWSGYRYYTTFSYSLVPLEQAEQITFICSDENLEIGSTIDGKQILAKSSYFYLPYTPSSSSVGYETQVYYFFSPDCSVATCSHYFRTAPYDPNDTWDAVENRPEGSYCYCYAVVKETEPDDERVLTDSFVIGDFLFENYNNSSTVEVSCANKNITLIHFDCVENVSHNGKTYVVNTFAKDAFKDCKKLVAVWLRKPYLLKSGAFVGCDNLKTIELEIETPPFLSDMANNGSIEDVFDTHHLQDVTIIIHKDKSQYTSNNEWNKFKDIVVREYYGDNFQGKALVDDVEQDINCKVYSEENKWAQIGYWTAGSQNWWTKAMDTSMSGVLKIPEYVKYNGKSYTVVLLGASSLRYSSFNEVVIPNSIYYLSGESLEDCYSLQKVSIGTGVTILDGSVFRGCNNLKEIFVYAAIPPGISYHHENIVFNGIPSDCILHVPAGCAEAYRTACGWRLFNNIVELETPTNIDGIPDSEMKLRSENGSIFAEGLADGTRVDVYTAEGMLMGSEKVMNGKAVIATSLAPGSIVIVRINDRSVKMVMK